MTTCHFQFRVLVCASDLMPLLSVESSSLNSVCEKRDVSVRAATNDYFYFD